MEKIQNALIIVGTDRNAGKTTLACRIIENNAQKTPIVAVKISPHFHMVDIKEEVVAKSENYIIIKECDPDSGKDSSRFLRSGAAEVYFMQVWDKDLTPAFEKLIDICGSDKAMLIESGWLRNIIEPSLFLIVNRKDNTEFKENIKLYCQLPHVWVESDGEEFSPSPNTFLFLEGQWAFTRTDD